MNFQFLFSSFIQFRSLFSFKNEKEKLTKSFLSYRPTAKLVLRTNKKTNSQFLKVCHTKMFHYFIRG